MAMKTQWNNAMEATLSALNRADTVVLMGHVSPDGDTLASLLALKEALEQKGKTVTACLTENVPQMLSFLKGAANVEKPEALAGRVFDLAVAVDVADERRMGAAIDVFNAAKATAQIDHHGTNPGYAQVNLVDGNACATGVLMYDIIAGLGAEMTRDMAICLYTAISTDTGNFSFDNTSARAFAIMSELMAYDLPLNDLSRVLFRQHSRPHIKLLGRALESLAFHADGRIASMTLTLADFEAAGAAPEHADGIVNYAIDTLGVQMAFLARESVRGDVKFSMRALPPYNVAKVAARFAGGGHSLAAGCNLPQPIQLAAEQMIAALKEEL